MASFMRRGQTRDTDDFNHGPRKILAQLEPHLTEPDDNGCVFYQHHEGVKLPLRASGGREATMQPSRAAWLAANPTDRLTADQRAVHDCDGVRPDLVFKSCCNPDHMFKGDDTDVTEQRLARAVRKAAPKTVAA